MKQDRRTRWSRRILTAAACCAVAGCGMFHSVSEADDDQPIKPASTQQTYSSVQPVPAALQPGNRPVVQDQLPLIYLVETNGTARVTNVETGEEIASFPVKESQIIRVESKGVLLANKRVIGAQLAPGTYAIEMVPEGAVASGVVQSSQTIVRAVPATKPATRPAGALTPKPAASPAANSASAPPAPK